MNMLRKLRFCLHFAHELFVTLSGKSRRLSKWVTTQEIWKGKKGILQVVECNGNGSGYGGGSAMVMAIVAVMAVVVAIAMAVVIEVRDTWKGEMYQGGKGRKEVGGKKCM